MSRRPGWSSGSSAQIPWEGVLFLALVSIGCGGGSPKTEQVAEATRFVLDWSRPTRMAVGDSIEGFSRVNWTGEMSDGTLVVGDNRLTELSFFPPSSSPSVVARQGEGPGELDFLIHGRVLASDSVLVSEASRFSIFTPAGEFQRSIPVPFPGYSHRIVGALGDSLFVVGLDISPLRPGLSADTVRYVVISASDGAIRNEFTRPFRWSYVDRPPDGRTFWTYPPFFGQGVEAVLGSRIIWGFGDDPFLRVLDLQGRTVDSVLVLIPGRQITEDEFRQAQEERLSRAREDPQRLRSWHKMFEEVAFPEVHPFFDDLIISGDGLLWLRVADEPASDTIQWWGQTIDGTLARILSVPSRFQVVEMSDSTAVGIEADSLGVQRILVLPMIEESKDSS